MLLRGRKPVTDDAEKLYAELAEARKGETARLEKILTDMKPGDVFEIHTPGGGGYG